MQSSDDECGRKIPLDEAFSDLSDYEMVRLKCMSQTLSNIRNWGRSVS